MILAEYLDGQVWNASLPTNANVSQGGITSQDVQQRVTWNFELDEDKFPVVRVSCITFFLISYYENFNPVLSISVNEIKTWSR